MVKWIDGDASDEDVVVSTRIRMARNLRNYKFPQRMSIQEAENITQEVLNVMKYLAEEGMTVDDFKNIVLLYNTSEAHKKIAQAAQEMWRVNLGIEIQLENVDFNVKLDREKAGDYHISRAGWIGDYMDPITFLELWWSKSSFNDVNYNNPEYDKLIEIAKTSADPKERFDAMKKAEIMLMEDMPVLPVYFYTQPYAQKSYVTGVFKPLNRYPVLTYADMNK